MSATAPRASRPMAGPRRQYRRAPEAIGRLSAHDSLPLIAAIIRRMRGQRNKTGAGSYVLGDWRGETVLICHSPDEAVAYVQGWRKPCADR